MTRNSIPITIGVVLVAVTAILAGAAMFLVDQGEETAHAYKALRARQDRNPTGLQALPGNDVELRGQWMGMTVANLDAASAQQMGLAQLDKGVAVVGVDPLNGGRAREAGVQAGDVVVGVDSQPVGDLADLLQVGGKLPKDAPVLLDVRRHGHMVTLVVPPQERELGVPAAFGPQRYCPRDGILVPSNGRGPATCPRCNGPLHMYHAGPRGAGPQANPWAMR